VERLETDGRVGELTKVIVEKKPNSPYLTQVKSEFRDILIPRTSEENQVTTVEVMKREDLGIDVGIIVALREEFKELFKQLPSPQALKDEETGITDYLFNWGKASAYQCAATFVGDMGPEKAALATERFIKRRQPKTVVMLGIAGGMNKDVKLGDVVVVTTANNYLYRGKAVANGESFTFEVGGDTYRCSDNVVREVQDLEFAHSQLYQEWQEEAQKRKEADLNPEQLQEQWIRKNPQYVTGAIASSSVVGAAQSFTEWLKQSNRNYLAIEMEGAGMLSAVYSHADPKKTLILRGISDFADERKQELDRIGTGGIRRYAMNNAISLLWKLIEAGILGNP
jgi:nucleoside phosphorylase